MRSNRDAIFPSVTLLLGLVHPIIHSAPTIRLLLLLWKLPTNTDSSTSILNDPPSSSPQHPQRHRASFSQVPAVLAHVSGACMELQQPDDLLIHDA